LSCIRSRPAVLPRERNEMVGGLTLSVVRWSVDHRSSDLSLSHTHTHTHTHTFTREREREREREINCPCCPAVFVPHPPSCRDPRQCQLRVEDHRPSHLSLSLSLTHTHTHQRNRERDQRERERPDRERDQRERERDRNQVTPLFSGPCPASARAPPSCRDRPQYHLSGHQSVKWPFC